MIIDMLVLCARRGMAVWIISSGIDAICEKTDNEEFLRRLRYIKERCVQAAFFLSNLHDSRPPTLWEFHIVTICGNRYNRTVKA